MAGPAQNGALIYSNNIMNLARFYQSLFDMKVLRETDDLISLDRNGFNLVIHTPPFRMPEEAFSRVKLFFTVDNINETKNAAINLGGQSFEGEWANPLFKVSNITDCDGNHIQIREFTDSHQTA
ncbi:MAG: hypothetical protein HWE27_09090 [Gammaproteobacteria bacterium]|nr:hypothetical protein [Gammaproteobacteria bacterium]